MLNFFVPLGSRSSVIPLECYGNVVSINLLAAGWSLSRKGRLCTLVINFANAQPLWLGKVHFLWVGTTAAYTLHSNLVRCGGGALVIRGSLLCPRGGRQTRCLNFSWALGQPCHFGGKLPNFIFLICKMETTVVPTART